MSHVVCPAIFCKSTSFLKIVSLYYEDSDISNLVEPVDAEPVLLSSNLDRAGDLVNLVVGCMPMVTTKVVLDKYSELCSALDSVGTNLGCETIYNHHISTKQCGHAGFLRAVSFYKPNQQK